MIETPDFTDEETEPRKAAKGHEHNSGGTGAWIRGPYSLLLHTGNVELICQRKTGSSWERGRKEQKDKRHWGPAPSLGQGVCWGHAEGCSQEIRGAETPESPTGV